MGGKVETLVKKLGLTPHPEGGYFKQTYLAEDIIKPPSRFNGDTRRASSHIYYLLESGDFSAWHRLKSDEKWHHYEGSPLTLYILTKEGILNQKKIGPIDVEGAEPYVCVKNGQWFAVEVDQPNSYALVGCDVSPGFDYQDWELANRNQMLKAYPDYKDLIIKFTRDPQFENQDNYEEQAYDGGSMSFTP